MGSESSLDGMVPRSVSEFNGIGPHPENHQQSLRLILVLQIPFWGGPSSQIQHKW